MATVYPIAMDLGTDFGVIVDITTETPYINIAYAQWENFDAVNATWTSKNQYNYWFALNSFSYNSINDIDSGVITHVSFSGPNVQIQFNAGQIVDLNGDPISLTTMLGEVTSALGL